MITNIIVISKTFYPVIHILGTYLNIHTYSKIHGQDCTFVVIVEFAKQNETKNKHQMSRGNWILHYSKPIPGMK